ncbi:hypothetical protein SDC9_61644 [bioreactor metagenome]|uniref:Zinc-ribbon domain-containing protein n=1 Tax=bioreactor metagenome TaxID=1076179 RepID=A0A644XGB2_9ZZZZ
MYCSHCGSPVQPNARFCVSCGTKVTLSASTPQPVNSSEPDENQDAVYAWGASNPDMKGLVPVRMKHVPPTDRKIVEAATIDVSGGPQLYDRVIKSQSAKAGYSVPIVFAIVAATLCAGGFAVNEPGLAWGSLAAALFLLFLGIVLASGRRKAFRLGFDWKTNTIWAMLDGKKPSYLGNASCITGLSINKNTTVTSRVANIGSSTNRVYTTVNDKKHSWQLVVSKSNNTHIPLFAFYSAKDAYRVLQKAEALLAQQK